MNIQKLLVAFVTVALMAPGIDFSGFRRVSQQDPSDIKLVNPNFEQGERGWSLGREGHIVRGIGSNGSSGLVISRNNPKNYQLVFQRVEGLLPGHRYTLKVMVRTENVKTQGKQGASCFIEHSDKAGKFLSMTGSYPVGAFGTHDWHEIAIDRHLVPHNAGSTSIGLYLGPKTTGTAYFDDVQLTPMDQPYVIYPLGASQNTIRKGQVLRFKILDGQCRPLDQKLKVHLAFLGHTEVSAIKGATAIFATAGDWEGRGDMTIRILDVERKLILTERTIPFQIGGRLPRVRFDRLGRTLVDGRPFMPIGAYCNLNQSLSPDQLKAVGFNTIMPGNSIRMDLHHWFKGAYDVKAALKGIHRVLDCAHKLDMKVIFGMSSLFPWGNRWWIPAGGSASLEESHEVAGALAAGIRAHPALLAYYGADEPSPNSIFGLEQRKNLLVSVDYDHPVWQVHSLGYNTSSLIPFAGSCDVIGIDPYPFTNPQESSLVKVEKMLRLAYEAELPQWIVPQMFNWKRYRKNSKGQNLQFPTLQEYRAQILLEAGWGMKGFIFFNFYPLWCEHRRELDGDKKTIMSTIVSGNALLRDMEPFIMADTQPKRLPLDVRSGKVSAWQFRSNDGRQRVAVVSLVPGNNVAELKLQGTWVSRWGKSILAKGGCRFDVENIDCDILELKP